MPVISKRQFVEHIDEVLEGLQMELDRGDLDNAVSISRHITGEIVARQGGVAIKVSGAAELPRDPSQSQSVIVAFNILAAFEGKTLLGISDIADGLGMSRSTTHRYVRTLLSVGQLEQDPATRKYRRA